MGPQAPRPARGVRQGGRVQPTGSAVSEKAGHSAACGRRQAAGSPPSVGSWGLYSLPGGWPQTWFLHHSDLCEVVSSITSAAGRVELQKVI